MASGWGTRRLRRRYQPRYGRPPGSLRGVDNEVEIGTFYFALTRSKSAAVGLPGSVGLTTASRRASRTDSGQEVRRVIKFSLRNEHSDRSTYFPSIFANL